MSYPVAHTAMADRANAFQKSFNLQFNDIELLNVALRAPGVVDREGNRGLALIGDSALKLALRIVGLERGLSRGDFSPTVDKICSNENLAQRGTALRIDQFIWCNPAQKSVGPGLMATTMQAIIGAYFKDQGKDFAAVLRVLAVLGLDWTD
ncbi:ribonuclease III domain-containing protein [Aspergillus varians]